MRFGPAAITSLRNFAKIFAETNALNFHLLLLLAIITFYPLFFGGFTTRDDTDAAINYGLTTNIFQVAKTIAEAQGRFTLLWGYLFLQVPYIIDSWAWYVALKFGAFFLLLSALYYAIIQIFKSSWIAIAAVLFYLSFIQNGWDYNALTSYPFAFNFYAVLFLVSLGLFSKAIDQNKMSLAIISAGLYFFALGIELFVLFFPFYIAILVSRSASNETFVRKLILGRKYLLTIALALIIYLGIYLVWRITHGTTYDGNSLNGFNLLAASRVIAVYSLSAFPLASINFIRSPELQMQFTSTTGLSGVLSELNAAHFIKPATAGLLFARLMTTDSFNLPKIRTAAVAAGLAGIGIFLPNLLLGFIQKHQNNVASGAYSYLYTYYSFIAAVIFAASVAAYINVKSRLWQPNLRLALIITGIVAMVGISFVVELRNQLIAFDQKLSHRKWQLMDTVIRSPVFLGIPEGSILVAPTLSAHSRGIASVTADYWSKYTKYKTGRNVRFVDGRCEIDLPCYSLFFRQELHADNQVAVLAKIKNQDSFVASELTIYSMPNEVGAVLMGSFKPTVAQAKIELNGAAITNVGAGFFSSELPYVSDGRPVQIISLTGNADISLDKITISHFGAGPLLRKSLAVEVGDGFYGWETGSDQPPWAWSKRQSEMRIKNYTNKATLVNVQFEVCSLESIELRILGGETARSFSVAPSTYVPVKLQLLAQPGVTRIDILSSRPPVQPLNGDPRFLSFSIRRLQIQN